MEIFRIATDFLFKNVSGKDGVTAKFHHYRGQKLAEEWTPLHFGLLENIARLKSEKNAEKKMRGDFDARCYGQIFLIKDSFIPHLNHLPLEFLPVMMDDIAGQFSFLNVLTVVEAIDFKGLDFKQSMDMLKSNSARFIRESIGSHIIFRDQKITGFYFCSRGFIELIEQHAIKGLRFERFGYAK